jgi:protease-4
LPQPAGRPFYVVILVIGLVVGLQVAPAAWSAALETETEGTVAIIPLEGGIDGAGAAAVSTQFQRARNDPSIDAAVLLVNSPGGGASASETLYMQISQASEEMPVVTSINAIAASGGYFALAPTDYVYTHPASFVGSVGTITTLPAEIEPIDIILTTGPNKQRGGDERDFHYMLSGVQSAFLNAVVENRDLAVPAEEIATARLYSGPEAVRIGLADEIGGLEAATRRAANEADLDSYDVTVLRPQGTTQFVTQAAYSASNASDKELVSPVQFTGRFDRPRAAPMVLMMPGSVVQAAIERSKNRSVRVVNSTEVNSATVTG